jgi:molybdate transport system regulatory protein
LRCDPTVWAATAAGKLDAEMTSLFLRIDLNAEAQIGPGKIELLERIAESGSISAAGRSMSMSYRRAWELVEELNGIFGRPVVHRRVGGKSGGGTDLTPLGYLIVGRYRAIEKAAEQVSQAHLAALQAELRGKKNATKKAPRT